MAHKVANEKGFLVIEVSIAECVDKFGGLGICDHCNKADFKGYYVAVLNHWLCVDCYKDFLSRATRYEEDKRIEERNYNHYCKVLGI